MLKNPVLQIPASQNLATPLTSAKFLGILAVAAAFFWQLIRGRVRLQELRRRKLL